MIKQKKAGSLPAVDEKARQSADFMRACDHALANPRAAKPPPRDDRNWRSLEPHARVLQELAEGCLDGASAALALAGGAKACELAFDQRGRSLFISLVESHEFLTLDGQAAAEAVSWVDSQGFSLLLMVDDSNQVAACASLAAGGARKKKARLDAIRSWWRNVVAFKSASSVLEPIARRWAEDPDSTARIGVDQWVGFMAKSIKNDSDPDWNLLAWAGKAIGFKLADDHVSSLVDASVKTGVGSRVPAGMGEMIGPLRAKTAQGMFAWALFEDSVELAKAAAANGPGLDWHFSPANVSKSVWAALREGFEGEEFAEGEAGENAATEFSAIAWTLKSGMMFAKKVDGRSIAIGRQCLEALLLVEGAVEAARQRPCPKALSTCVASELADHFEQNSWIFERGPDGSNAYHWLAKMQLSGGDEEKARIFIAALNGGMQPMLEERNAAGESPTELLNAYFSDGMFSSAQRGLWQEAYAAWEKRGVEQASAKASCASSPKARL